MLLYATEGRQVASPRRVPLALGAGTQPGRGLSDLGPKRRARYVGPVDVLGLDHVQLAAPRGCEEEARHFFGAVLGLLEIQKPDALIGRGGVWFTLGEQELHVGVEEPFSPASKAHPALLVAPGKLDAIAERLRAAGARVRWDEAVPGSRRFYTEDPWGNRIELLSLE
jgi:catechol 2,3-dioxygenase-like lactoylglutathione lyase family enzyme